MESRCSTTSWIPCAAAGRRLRQIDEAAWKDAERLLCDEFSYVLGAEPHEILPRLRLDIQ